MNKALVIAIFLLFMYLLLLCSCGSGSFDVNVKDSKHEIILKVDSIELVNQIKNECIEEANTKEEILICVDGILKQLEEVENEIQE